MTAEVREVTLAIVVEVLLDIAIEAGGRAERSVGRVEVEESQAHVVRFLEIAIENLHVVAVQQLAIGIKDFLVADGGIGVAAKRDVEFTLRILAVKAVEACAVEED